MKKQKRLGGESVPWKTACSVGAVGFRESKSDSRSLATSRLRRRYGCRCLKGDG